jgi:hypothetical protein
MLGKPVHATRRVELTSIVETYGLVGNNGIIERTIAAEAIDDRAEFRR